MKTIHIYLIFLFNFFIQNQISWAFERKSIAGIRQEIELNSLIEMKKAIDEHWHQIQTDFPYSIERFREKSKAEIERMSYAHKERVLLNLVNEKKFEEIELAEIDYDVKKWIESFNENYGNYFELVDNYNQQLHRFLIHFSFRKVESYFKKKVVNSKQHSLMIKLNQQYQEYCEQESQFGKNKDYKRMFAFREFFKIVDKLMKTTGNLPDPEFVQNPPSVIKGLNYLAYITMLPSAVNLYTKFTHCPSTKLATRISRLEKECRSYQQFMGELGDLHQMHTIFNNMQYWPPLPWPQINPENKRPYFYLVAPQHSSAIQDGVALSRLPLPPHLVFAAAYHNFPQFIAKGMDKSEAIIVVDGDKEQKVHPDALAKFFESIGAGVANVAVNFLQGSVPLIGENHALRPQSATKLIHAIVKSGFDLQILPISNKTPSDFLDYENIFSPLTTTLTLEEPIGVYEYALWTFYTQKSKYSIILNVIRAHWESRKFMQGSNNEGPEEYTSKIINKYFTKRPGQKTP